MNIKKQSRNVMLNLTPSVRNLVSFGIASIITLIVFLFGENVILSRAHTQFNRDANQIEKSLNNNVKLYRDLLFSVHSFIETNPQFTYTDLNKYVGGLNTHEKYQALQVMRYITPVQSAELDLFYEGLKKEYTSSIEDPVLVAKVTQSINHNKFNTSEMDLHYIVKYTIPLNQDHDFVGKDLSDNSNLASAFVESMQSPNIVSSGLMYKGKTIKGLDTKYIGLSLGTFNSQNYKFDYRGTISIGVRLDSSLFADINNGNSYIDYQIIDNGLGEKPENNLLYDSRYQRPNINDAWPNWLKQNESALFTKHYEIQIGKRNFEVFAFTQKLPPNFIELNFIYIVALIVFILSFVLSVRWLSLENAKEAAKEIATKMTNELRVVADTDSLTMLPNRRAFMKDLSDSISAHAEEKLFLMFIDLDGFKRVNDTLGHQAGDKVLKEFSSRLTQYTQKARLRCYRIGGDEFTVIIEPRVFDKAVYQTDIEKIAMDILSLTREKFKVDNEEFTLSESLGVAEYPFNGATPEQLFKNSDIAMYEAKHSGKNQYLFYSKNMNNAIAMKSQMENLLLSAIEKKEFYIVFQPKLQKVEGGFIPIGAEVLLRWKNEKLGEVSPMIFIPIAEEANLMSKIGFWVLEETAKCMHKWAKLGLENVNISINASAKEFNNKNLVNQYVNIINQYNISADKITIELTESTMMKHPEKTLELLTDFKNQGFKISVDDFGTGYSALSYLRKYPVNEIKIDKSFTNDILIDPLDRIVIEGIITMSQKLGLNVVIEGVETREQVDWLEALGPVQMQGYYFSQPLKEIDLIHFWKSGLIK